MKVLWIGALALALALLSGCGEEPERIVSARTGDGGWELTLEARKNALRPSETLPVQVRLVSLAGQPAETFRDTIALVANNGTLNPARLVFTFVGAADSLFFGDGFTTSYIDWVTFTASTAGGGFGSQPTTGPRQGEVIALFRDVEAVLKIRIVE